MPIRLKILMVISGLVLFLIALSSFFGLNKTPSEVVNLTLTYSEVLENFETGTKIEIIYADALNKIIDNKNLEIKENKVVLNQDHNFSNIIYKIEKENDFIDINISQNNKGVSAEISGLPARAKVLLGQDRDNSTQSTPADWAGKISLSSNQADSFCLSWSAGKTYKICHLKTQQVAS